MVKIPGRICCKCGIDDSTPQWFRYYKGENWTGRWLCRNCHLEVDRSKTRYIREKRLKGIKCCICSTDLSSNNAGRNKYYGENGNWNRKSYLCDNCYCKSKTQCRTMCVDPKSNLGMSIISEKIIGDFLGIKSCNEKMNNYSFPIDMLHHEKYGKIDVKASSLRQDGKSRFNTRRKVDCDHYFLLGFDKNMRIIDVVYIVANDEWIASIPRIEITRNSVRTSVYDKFLVDPKPYNDIYVNLKMDDLPMLRNDNNYTFVWQALSDSTDKKSANYEMTM